MSMAADAPLEVGMRQARTQARAEQQRREAGSVDPDAVVRADRAVREFPVSAYAESVLPLPLAVERAERLPRSQRQSLGSGHTVKFELVETPGELRGWVIDPELAVSIHGDVVHPVYESVGRSHDAALPVESQRTGLWHSVTGRVVRWESGPVPLTVNGVPLERVLAEFVAARSRR